MTKDRDVAWFRIAAVSTISTMNVDWPDREVVLQSDPREYPVDQADRRGRGWDEAADLGHQRDERDLPDIRRLARHVRPGQHDELLAAARHLRVVGDKGAGRQGPLDDRVAAFADLERVAVVQLRADVAVLSGDLRQAAEDVRPGRRLPPF